MEVPYMPVCMGMGWDGIGWDGWIQMPNPGEGKEVLSWVFWFSIPMYHALYVSRSGIPPTI